MNGSVQNISEVSPTSEVEPVEEKKTPEVEESKEVVPAINKGKYCEGGGAGCVIDLRTGHKKDVNVGAGADDVTKKADEEEYEFIERVEEEHKKENISTLR